MIIHGVTAENVLKYARLELLDLPETGNIAVSGLNESGKSTIGETVCFALFGRTFSLNEADISKVIRWDEVRCSVALVFSVEGDDARYEITRYLDSEGNHSAGLQRLGDSEGAVARGLQAVNDALYKLIGFGYDEFIESFYLAQREITTPHPHSHSVKAMAGVITLERCGEDFAHEAKITALEIPEQEQRLEASRQQLEALAIDEARLGELEAERDACAEQNQQRRTLLESLQKNTAFYQESLPTLRRARRGRTQTLVLLILLALATFLPLIGGIALTVSIDSGFSQAMSGLLGGLFSGLEEGETAGLFYTAFGCGVLLLLVVGMLVLLDKRVSGLQQSLQRLADDLDALSSVTTRVDDMARASLQEERNRLRDRVLEASAVPEELHLHVEQEAAWLRDVIAHGEAELAECSQAVDEEQARVDLAATIKQACDDIQDNITRLQTRVRQYEMAQELLHGAICQLSQSFNHHLRKMACKTLPLFTDGRYEHLQIDEDLNVRAFSSEKHDFMELDEISSGTQRQIMLAVRLALSQELVDRAGMNHQFLFLDEPFAFFDESRTRNSLAVLPKLSEALSQIWVVAQHFPEDSRFALHIKCAREIEELTVSGSSTVAEPA